MAVNASPAPCPRAFSRKFRANSSKPRKVLWPTPAKRGATNPIQNILTPRKNSPAGCAARQHRHDRAASRPAERVLLRSLALAARLAQAILSSASVSATPLTARARSSALKAMATSENLPSASPTTEQKNSWKDTRISAGHDHRRSEICVSVVGYEAPTFRWASAPVYSVGLKADATRDLPGATIVPTIF